MVAEDLRPWTTGAPGCAPAVRRVGSASATGGVPGCARARAGFTLVELLIVLVITGLMLTIAVPRFRGLENQLQNAAMETASFFRQARTSAMARTSAYRVVIVSDTELRGEYATSCAATTWTDDPRTRLVLRDGVVMEGSVIVAGDELVCYNARGVADASPVFNLKDLELNGQLVEVFLGGAVRTTPIP
jgi:prepilin-type N-terminal cleavage/methylation domain-containing protein